MKTQKTIKLNPFYKKSIYTKLKLFFLSSIFIASLSFSQTTFQKTFGGTANEQANDVQELAGGGYIIAGRRIFVGNYF